MLEANWPLVLLGLRIGVAVVLYVFLLVAIRALRAEVRARTMPYVAPRQRRDRYATDARRVEVAERPLPAQRVARPSAVPSSARLEVVAYEGEHEDNGLTGRSYVLDGPVLIGRSKGNTIVLPERHVSSRHARLFPENGAWWVEDLGSTNGTYVGGHRVSGRERLDPADEVRFGPVVARIRTSASGARNGAR